MSEFDFENVPEYVRWDKVWPDQPPPGHNIAAARDYALRRLFEYLSEVTWRRTGRTWDSPPVEFQIKPCNLFTEQPDGNVELSFPAIGVLPNPHNWDMPVLGPPVFLDETFNKYGYKTVLVEYGEFQEDLVLDVWCNTKAERRAILAGMEGRVFATQYGPLYLTLPDYYDQIATFELTGTTRFDGDNIAKNRVEAHVRLEFRVPRVFLVNARMMQPHPVIETE